MGIILLAAGIVTMAFGLLTLLGWVFGWLRLASFGANRIPMAPSTAVLFLLYGAAICLRARTPLSRRAQGFSAALAGLVALVALLLFTLGWLHIHWAGERLGLNVTGTVGGAPIGHMSLATAFCFLLAGVSFLASLSPSATRPWRVGLALVSAGVLLATSFIFLLAYSLGTPLLYGSTFIPPALNTILAFSTLGLALLALALRPAGLFRGLSGDDAKPAFSFVLIFFLLVMGIVATGYAYYRNYERRYRAKVEQELSVIAQLKVGELVQFRAERMGDALVLSRNPIVSQLVRRFLAPTPDAEARQQLQAWFGKYRWNYQYDEVFLLDAQGGVRLSASEAPVTASAAIVARVPEVLRSAQPLFHDFYRQDISQQIYLSLLIPVHDETDGDRPLGVLVLRVNPELYLYPFIQSWPTPSPTAETVLVRREGSNVVYLNELRFQTNSALVLHLPTDRAEIPAVRAVLGQTGIIGGVDYRGVPVLAYAQAVPDSPWILVAKLDAAEAYAPMWQQLWQVVGIIGLLLFATGAGVGLVWRQQRLVFYQKQATAAETLRESESKYSRLVEGVPDIIYTFSSQRGGLYYSAHTEAVLGYPVAHLLEHPFLWQDSIEPADLEKIRLAVQKFATGAPFDLEYRIKDSVGRWHWLRDRSIGHRQMGNDLIIEVIATDITASKQTEEALHQSRQAALNLMTDAVAARDLQEQISQALRASESLYRSLFDSMLNGFAYCKMLFKEGRPSDFVYLTVNRAFEKLTGLRGVTGKRVTEVIPGIREADPELFERYGRVAMTGNPETFEIYLASLSGWYSVAVYCPEREHFVAVFEVITERKQAEESLRRTNRALRLISECNQALVRATAEADLLEAICRMTVEHGGYRMVWVGFAEQNEAKSVRTVAQAGFEAGYLDTVNITWADDERGRGPTGTSIRTRQPVVARNIPTDPAYGPWRAAAIQRGYASSATLPLTSGENTFGALMVYAGEPDAFNAEEIELLTELADDLAYGITALRTRAEHAQAEAEICELNRSLEQRVQERTAELLAANQELNAFAYAVSHDLRQPLRAMNGFSQALVEDCGATLSGAAHEHLDEIILASRRMGELIDGLLRLSRSTRGELQRDAVDLSALAARLLGELAAAEPERRVTWTVAPGLTARGDERMVEVVLANLLGNAWKYTAQTPQPKIEVGALEYRSNAVMGEGQDSGAADSGAAPAQPAPVFFVRDNGAGFDMQHAAKL
ncbi:MAG: GAF domain-containing protein, partial [Planctomycetota bacterium]|nr:GAF domain-containing protein [Planctomycetota bacterium]